MHTGTVTGNTNAYSRQLSRRLPSGSGDINGRAEGRLDIKVAARRRGRTGPLRQEPLSRPGSVEVWAWSLRCPERERERERDVLRSLFLRRWSDCTQSVLCTVVKRAGAE